ncbi:aspartate/tyrosine/aromatic aminotransferase [Roseiconus nitratireducens]|uniref:Aspartate/tyrosine/aromatic aminotransferase n=1 Tax=Roseiconus nitratireducens TaxID=2605748 RepID=A0A5M6D8U7_9BACT|nr:amino acid aminotransferase [Roseiconus nitratireducens]KAA5543773.1 aspartate/tyrosine/aromatic aminotransferase [Roseiconus nitratireducens]
MTHRFSVVQTAPPDSILGLTEAFNADPNPDKMNLSVGVYKDESGKTPVLKSVKEAEKRLIDSETSKGYLSIDGMVEYREDVRRMVFGDAIAGERVAVLQAPGGTGALRVAADFMRTQLPDLRIWIPTPTWANHPAIFSAAELPTSTYRYLGADRTSLDLPGMLEDLRENAATGDAVLLHGCCHNPTGIDPSEDDWKQIAKVIADKQLLPLIDFAYQGFGDGLEQDAVGLRTVLEQVDEAIVCTSFSKNFGLYSERVGAISLVAADAGECEAARSQLKRIVRTNYSNPPRHGGAIVATILADESLTALWKEELEAMRTRITALRESFVQTMESTGKGYDFSFLLRQKGMFSFSGLTPMQVDELKSRHSIYIVGSGRINVAGMSESRMQTLCDAVASVMS